MEKNLWGRGAKQLMEGVSTYDMNRVRRINIWYEQGVYM
jgi:hypothetical protein